MKKILLGIVVIAAIGYVVFNYINKDTYENGIFRSGEFGFTLYFPDKWKEVDKKEVLKTSNERLMVRNVDTRMFLTFSNPDDAVFVISSLDQTKENFDNITLETVSGRFKSAGMEIELEEKTTINGFTMIRVGGPVGQDQYMQVCFFPAAKGIIQFTYVCKNSSYAESIEEVTKAIYSLKSI